MKFLIRKIRQYKGNIGVSHARKAYGVLSGTIGIIANILLFIIKLLCGLIINSIAVISDAFNNLSDSVSSVITLVGARLSEKPPDKEHPYGHGRYEYISSLAVAFIVFTMGYQLLLESFEKIMNPEPVKWNTFILLILILSVLIKIWLFFFNYRIAKKLNSTLIMANARDSLSDVIATTGVIVGTVVGKFVPLPLDGILGLFISLFILYSGFSIARDSIHFLLGPSPDPQDLKQIENVIARYGKITNAHNLQIHDYGPGKKLASLHVELPANMSVEQAHEIIHELEEKIKNELTIDVVIHVDPEGASINETKRED